jgi:hypothetical protein
MRSYPADRTKPTSPQHQPIKSGRMGSSRRLGEPIGAGKKIPIYLDEQSVHNTPGLPHALPGG